MTEFYAIYGVINFPVLSLVRLVYAGFMKIARPADELTDLFDSPSWEPIRLSETSVMSETNLIENFRVSSTVDGFYLPLNVPDLSL